MEATNTNNVTRLRGNDGSTPTRTPPVNFEAEQALLGAVLANNLVYDRVNEFLRPEHFADPLHGRIFETMSHMIERGGNAIVVRGKGGIAGAMSGDPDCQAGARRARRGAICGRTSPRSWHFRQG